jgi:hypothetical protein
MRDVAIIDAHSGENLATGEFDWDDNSIRFRHDDVTKVWGRTNRRDLQLRVVDEHGNIQPHGWNLSASGVNQCLDRTCWLKCEGLSWVADGYEYRGLPDVFDDVLDVSEEAAIALYIWSDWDHYRRRAFLRMAFSSERLPDLYEGAIRAVNASPADHYDPASDVDVVRFEMDVDDIEDPVTVAVYVNRRDVGYSGPLPTEIPDWSDDLGTEVVSIQRDGDTIVASIAVNDASFEVVAQLQERAAG